MSSAGISFAGLASGLDSASIIKSLVSLERRPIGFLQLKRSKFDQQSKLFGTLQTKLDKLQEMAKQLKLQSKVLDYTASADKENVVQLTAGDNAIPGTYAFEINKLAQAQTRGSSSHASNATTYADGTLQFKFADSSNDFFVDVKAGTNPPTPLTLDEIANQINEGSDGKIKASVIFEGGSGGYRLTLTSGVEGEDGAFNVTETSGFGTLDSLMQELDRGAGQPDNSGIIVGAQNAELKINGLTIQRSSNTITDIIPGVSIQLTGKTTGKVTITVATDLEKSSKTMQDFVDAYNDVIDFVNEQGKVVVEQNSGSSGSETKVTANALAGDSLLQSVKTRIRSVLSQTVGTGNEAYVMLAQIGIDADRDGHLTFDQSEFEEAVSNDSKAVIDIFSNSTSGIASSLMESLDMFTDSVDGLIKARTDGIGRVKRDIDNQIERLERRITVFEDNLRQRYAALEETIGRLEAQRGALFSLQSFSSQGS